MREQRKRLEGVVVSDKMDKTIVVRLESVSRHPLYGKVMRSAQKVHAHDENNDAQEGDRVRIMESRPYSKTKKWVLVSVLERPERV
ncbi:MAG: 30S ribosomal protein S17 [Ardenticatenales bacterium]|nr:30S ribosomal protein S17 [Ardenticatenales bacterium]MCB9171960.1 30S ribosomal protein S17 [Ardenticatenales bacterium]